MIPAAHWICVRGSPGHCLHPGLMLFSTFSRGIPAYICSKHHLKKLLTHTFAVVGVQVTVQRTQMVPCMWWLWILAHGPQMEVAWPPAESWSWTMCSMSGGQCCLRSAMTSSRYTSWPGCWGLPFDSVCACVSVGGTTVKQSRAGSTAYSLMCNCYGLEMTSRAVTTVAMQKHCCHVCLCC